MSTDKEEFAPYCEAKWQSQKTSGIKGGFTDYSKIATLLWYAMDDNDYMKTF